MYYRKQIEVVQNLETKLLEKDEDTPPVASQPRKAPATRDEIVVQMSETGTDETNEEAVAAKQPKEEAVAEKQPKEEAVKGKKMKISTMDLIRKNQLNDDKFIAKKVPKLLKTRGKKLCLWSM